MNPEQQDDLQAEYPAELIKSGVRGKYAKRYREGSNVVVIEPELDEEMLDPTHFVIGRANQQSLRAAGIERAAGIVAGKGLVAMVVFPAASTVAMGAGAVAIMKLANRDAQRRIAAGEFPEYQALTGEPPLAAEHALAEGTSA